MRSASNVARASWIATSGSLSPVSPAASMPSSSSRSTVSSCATSASWIASSESETQNASGDWFVAGETTSTSAPSTSSPSVGAQQVRVDGLRGDYQQLHVAVATPWLSGAKRCSGPPRTRTATTATSSRGCPPWAPSASRSTAAAIAERVRAGAAREERRQPIGRRAAVGLGDAVGVEHQRVAGRELDRLLGELRHVDDAQQRARATRRSRPLPSARSTSGSGCPPADTHTDTRSTRGVSDAYSTVQKR